MIKTAMVGRQPQIATYRLDYGKLATLDNQKIDGLTEQYHKITASYVLAHCIAKQVEAGIDIISEGEVFRTDYWSYFLSYMDGVEKVEPVMANIKGQWRTPWVVSGIPKLKFNVSAADWETAQVLTSKPVKITIPGPLTLATYVDLVKSEFSLETLAEHFSALINKEILHLVSKGCMHIQVDDPQLAIKPDSALKFGIQAMGNCFKDVPNEVNKYLHVCRGYPNADTFKEATNKASEDCYLEIMHSLNESPVDIISIENAFHPSPEALFKIISNKTLMLGVINIKSSEVEEPTQIVTAVKKVLKFIPKERLILAPDCGCACDPNRFFMKMKNLVIAAKSF